MTSTQKIAPVHGWKLRALMAVSEWLALLGISTTSAKALKMRMEKRAAAVPANWMLRPMPETGVERDTLRGRGGGAIPVKRFLPRMPKANATPILFLHGGGWIAGGVDSLDYLCTNLYDRLGTIVIAVGYRLAPEHPFPAALEDC
ncbi:alpha/beta hydrolase fold [Solimonas aquatica]|uniref:Alpha/beta hydrolase fold n=1 Tax=Solimonas aquatica TaxID=489703 RepID=A0A1H9A9M5_9GAMM|nr:alpha/beta hydrolase [Solimonas aquatica]SEP73466.1 alpha/beta hydrolase fold [Solimonas aquatica]